MVRDAVLADPLLMARTGRIHTRRKADMHIKTIPAKLTAAIAPLALTAAIMAPTAGAAVNPPAGHGAGDHGIQLRCNDLLGASGHTSYSPGVLSGS
jgi:hypothetical protein